MQMYTLRGFTSLNDGRRTDYLAERGVEEAICFTFLIL